MTTLRHARIHPFISENALLFIVFITLDRFSTEYDKCFILPSILSNLFYRYL